MDVKTASTELIEKKELREQLIGRVETLNKVKQLFLLPKLEVMTVKQLAEYFEAPLETIKSCYKYNQNEVDQDGVSIKTLKDFLKVEFQPLVKTQGKTVFKIDENVTLEVPNRGLLMFPQRAILRIAMLLRDSEIAKEVRTQLLNTFEHATTEEKTHDINEETIILLNLAKALTVGTKEDYVYASKDYFDFQNRHISVLKDRNNELASNNKALTGEILEWSNRSKLNRVIRLVASARNTKFQYIWKELYDELLYKHHIGLQMRGKPPLIQHIKENEWKAVIKSLSAICEVSGINTSEIFKKAKLN